MPENVDSLTRFWAKMPKRESMMTNPKSAFTRSRLRNVLCSLVFVAAGIAVFGAIVASRAIAQQAGESASLEEDSWGQMDISADVGPTPPPTPTCSPPCILPVTWTENFDNVSPPALPPDWLATNALGPPPFWVTSNSGVPIPPADTPPNAAFINDPAVASDKRLDSPQGPVPIVSETQLTFRHNFNLEASDADPSLGFDGGVLEISTDGGNTFQDILAAGGSFIIGGYNRTISTDRGSPIAGRQAWSGNSHGFITTVVDLGNLFIFTNWRLRWRMASDNSGSGEGWRADTVSVVSCVPVPCFTPTPTPFPTPTPGPVTLSARGRKVEGINTVRLRWSGAASNQVDVYRNGVLIVTTANDGSYIDSTGDTGRARYTYRVCQAGTSTCSNDATVRFPQ